jgi:ribonuclease P protein component
VRRGEFEVVYRGGKRLSAASFVVFARANGLGHSRFGISVKKALGGAVVRNRVKRRVREILRLNFSEIPSGWDIVVHPRQLALREPFANLAAELLRLIAAAAKAKERA